MEGINRIKELSRQLPELVCPDGFVIKFSSENLETMKKETIEEVGIIGGLVGVQFVYAANSVFQRYLMSLGLDLLTIVIAFTFATFLLLTPFAILFERKLWPRSLSSKLVVKLILISFAGVTMFQTLYLEGMKLTSPSIATAMPNLSPALIFIIAWIIRIEKVRLSCLYSGAKIGGTVLCVIVAFTMSLMHSTTTSTSVKEVNDLSAFPNDIEQRLRVNPAKCKFF